MANERIPVPNPYDPSEILWCDPCVGEVPCPHCRAPKGWPCRGSRGSTRMGNWIRGRHYKRAYLATALRRGKERVSWSDKTVQEILADAERRATRDAVDWRGNPIGDA